MGEKTDDIPRSVAHVLLERMTSTFCRSMEEMSEYEAEMSARVSTACLAAVAEQLGTMWRYVSVHITPESLEEHLRSEFMAIDMYRAAQGLSTGEG